MTPDERAEFDALKARVAALEERLERMSCPSQIRYDGSEVRCQDKMGHKPPHSAASWDGEKRISW